jgi:hypothetical protein
MAGEARKVAAYVALFDLGVDDVEVKQPHRCDSQCHEPATVHRQELPEQVHARIDVENTVAENEMHHALIDESGVRIADATRSDVLWHSIRSITDHYSMAQIMEIHAALEKITQPSNGWNKSLQTLKAENALRKANLGGGQR